MKRKQPYDAFHDLLETHRENGYLLSITVILFFLDVAMALLLFMWPAPDTYLVPGVDRYGIAQVNWGAKPPVMLEQDLRPPPVDEPTKVVLPTPPPPASQELPPPPPAASDEPAKPSETTQ